MDAAGTVYGRCMSALDITHCLLIWPRLVFLENLSLSSAFEPTLGYFYLRDDISQLLVAVQAGFCSASSRAGHSLH